MRNYQRIYSISSKLSLVGSFQKEAKPGIILLYFFYLKIRGVLRWNNVL